MKPTFYTKVCIPPRKQSTGPEWSWISAVTFSMVWLGSAARVTISFTYRRKQNILRRRQGSERRSQHEAKPKQQDEQWKRIKVTATQRDRTQQNADGHPGSAATSPNETGPNAATGRKAANPQVWPRRMYGKTPECLKKALLIY